MQINVPPEMVLENMAQRLAQMAFENARLSALNDVLMGRLREYEQRDKLQKVETVPSPNGTSPEQPVTSSD